MNPIEIKNPEQFRKEIENLDFLVINNVGENYEIRCGCDDWFAIYCKDNLFCGFDSEENELTFLRDLNLNYISFEQLYKFIGVIKNHSV